jgi:hypothetical protein
MATIVVGGHARKVGKTALTAGLIRAFAQYPWTAAKISSHWHDNPGDGEICAIQEERIPGKQSDSARFLAAGAKRSFYIRIREAQTQAAMPILLPVLQSNPFVIIESNCILSHIHPDLYIMVLRYDVEDFKTSARETIDRLNAVVAIKAASAPPWAEFVREKTTGIPVFTWEDPSTIPSGLLRLVSSRL